MTIEFIGWGENTEVRLIDELGTCRRFWMETVHIVGPGGYAGGSMDAEFVYENMKELAPPPIIRGQYSHLHPLANGKDEQS